MNSCKIGKQTLGPYDPAKWENRQSGKALLVPLCGPLAYYRRIHENAV